MEIIYLKKYTRLYIPTELDGSAGAAVLEVDHRNRESSVYWHLDDNYIGSTTRIHQMVINPQKGKHKLHLVDEQGRELTISFEVISDGVKLSRK